MSSSIQRGYAMAESEANAPQATEILAAIGSGGDGSNAEGNPFPIQPTKKDKLKMRHDALMSRESFLQGQSTYPSLTPRHTTTGLSDQAKSSPYARPKKADGKVKAVKKRVKTVKSMRDSMAAPMSELGAALDEVVSPPSVGGDKSSGKKKKEKGPAQLPKSNGKALSATQRQRVL